MEAANDSNLTNIKIDDADYEKDPRFIEYMRLLLKHSQDERNLVPADDVFAAIKNRYGWA
jgi:hypothetical protein